MNIFYFQYQEHPLIVVLFHERFSLVMTLFWVVNFQILSNNFCLPKDFAQLHIHVQFKRKKINDIINNSILIQQI